MAYYSTAALLAFISSEQKAAEKVLISRLGLEARRRRRDMLATLKGAAQAFTGRN